MKSIRAAILGGAAAREQYGEALKYLPQVQITGLIDTDKRAFRAWSDVRPTRIPVFADLTPLKAAHPDTEILLLSSGPLKRSYFISVSLNLGLHVLSDAPYSSTLIETDSLMRSAADNAVQIVPLFTHRINPSSLAFHTQIGERTSNPLSSARAEHRLSQESHGQFGESLKDLVVRTAICSFDWGRWCFGEALSISADLNPLLLTEHEGISVRGSYNSRIATILVQYERASCTHQISLARGQTGSERFQFTCQEGTLDLTSHPPNLPGATPEIHWRRKSGVVEPLAFPIPTSEFGFNIDQARSYLMLASLGEIWLNEDKADILGLARSAQEIYVAAVVSSRSQTKVRLPLQGVGSVKV